MWNSMKETRATELTAGGALKLELPTKWKKLMYKFSRVHNWALKL